MMLHRDCPSTLNQQYYPLELVTAVRGVFCFTWPRIHSIMTLTNHSIPFPYLKCFPVGITKVFFKVHLNKGIKMCVFRQQQLWVYERLTNEEELVDLSKVDTKWRSHWWQWWLWKSTHLAHGWCWDCAGWCWWRGCCGWSRAHDHGLHSPHDPGHLLPADMISQYLHHCRLQSRVPRLKVVFINILK